VEAKRFWRGPWPWVAAAGALAAYAVFHWSAEPDRLANVPDVGDAEQISALAKRRDVNVLFVLIDTLRADHLHAYGYRRPTSPVFDLLASQGVRFAQQSSQSSWTKCSMASLWTSLYPARSGITRFDQYMRVRYYVQPASGRRWMALSPGGGSSWQLRSASTS